MTPFRWTLTLVVAGAGALACSSASTPGTGMDASTPDTSPQHDASGPKKDSAPGTDAPPPADGGEAGATTWGNFAQGFFATYCVKCHNASTPNPNQNFNLYTDVKGLDSTIICGVSPKGDFQAGCPKTGFPPPGQFPIGTGPYPTDAERLRIVAWIKAGAPQN